MNWEDQDIDDLFRNSGSESVPPFNDDFWAEMENRLPDDGKGVDEPFILASSGIQAPPYKNAYWKEMQAMLPERKRRVAAFWWYGAAGIAALFIVLGTLFFTAKPVDDNNLSQLHGREFTDRELSAAEMKQPGKKTDPRSAALTESAEGLDHFVSPDVSPSGRREASDFSGKLNAGAPGNEVVAPREPEGIDPLTLNKTGVSYNMARASYDLPQAPGGLPLFFVQAGAGLGQSFVRNAPGSQLVHFYSVGAGIQKQIRGMYVSAGINGRVDFVDNISRLDFQQSSDIAVASPEGIYTRSDFRQLYALEMPLTIAFGSGRNLLGASFVPGFQLGYTGTYLQYDQNKEFISRGRKSGKLPQSKTLTMELGLVYLHSFTGSWSAGCSISTDLITPIGDEPYVGTYRRMPVNGAVFIRRNF